MTRRDRYTVKAWTHRRLTALLVMAALAVLGFGAADSRRPDVADRETASGLPAPVEARGAAIAELYAVPPSPFMHGSTEGSFSPAPVGEARWISLSNGIRIDTRAGEPALAAELRLEGYPAGRPGYYLVQFEGPILHAWRGMLEEAGAEILAYLPNYTYLVRLEAQVLEAVRRLSPVVWTGLYQPAYKVSGQPEMAGDTGRQIMTLLLFPGESLAEVEEAIVSGGGRVLERASGRNLLLRAEIDRASVPGLVRMPGVAWIEPWHPQQLYNDRAQWVVQTFVSGLRKVWDNGIRGQNQVISSSDTGVRTDHNAFRDAAVPITTWGDYPTHRKIIAYWKTVESPDIAFGDHAPAFYHGTHTGGTLVGNDDPFAASAYDGMAKDARLYFLDGGTSTSDGVILPVNLYGMFYLPYNGNAGGAARIMSNSWGHSTGGAYDADAMQVDQFMWDNPDFLLFFSNGNAGAAGSVGSPATAKDCVSAGGTLNGTQATTIYGLTSRGPTADGRRKPTICAPARLTSANGAGTAGYVQMEGTSMASPCMASATLLARQYLADGWYPSGSATPAHAFNPSAALLKAMAVNSGQNDITSYTVPDNNIGWGRILLDQVLFFPGDTRHTVLVDNGDGLLTGEYVEYEFYVSDTSLPLRISLVWTDYPGTPGAATILVNDLNLTATGGGQTYLGNVFSGGQSVTGGSADNLNVEECVWRTTPAAGIWRVRVNGGNVPFAPQPYALVVSGGLGGDAGVVMLDKGYYNGSDSLGIRVEDLNAGASVNVTVSSNTETAPETVALPLAGSGVYVGSFPTSLDSARTGDGQLSVSHGDLITARYTDTSPAHTSTATATVLMNGPVITDVASLDVGSTSAVIGWTSSTLATTRIYYGTTLALGSETTLETDLVTSHLQTLTGLTTGTTYYYDVESMDHYGNVVQDDNGGSHYRFTTRVRGDVLLVLGDETFTEVDKYRDAFLRTGWTWDEWGEALALDPPVGDLTSGLRSYRAVWWQVGWEQYPAFSDDARDSISKFDAGGARWAVSSHDVAWDFGDSVGAPDWTAEREAWLASELHANWLDDPTTFSFIKGLAGDPISGAYTANVSYTPARSGAAGDEVDALAGTGTVNVVWRNTLVGTNNIGIRWEAGSTSGDPDSAVWGGARTRTVANFLEWSRIRSATVDDTVRADILDKTIRWLVGREHPLVSVIGPNGGEVFPAGPVSISWTETPDGASIASRQIEYSDDSGQSWNLITSSPGSSPYSWDISVIPNGTTYRVRVTVVDNGTPTLTGYDDSNADFQINRPGGDTRGPVVVAGSAVISPNPAVGLFALTATLDDRRTGGSNIAAAEWNVGSHALPPGTGTAMSVASAAPVSAVNDTIDAGTLPDGPNTLWIRGQDAAGAWGTADGISIMVHRGATSIAEGPGAAAPRFALRPNVPNPFNPETTIRFSLERDGRASLTVFDVAGRAVRRLVNGEMSAGAYEVRWDGRDASGHSVASGIYFYRLEAGGQSAVQKMVLMK